MWWAVCRECDFTALRIHREQAEDALHTHIAHTKHQQWSIMLDVDCKDPDRSDE